MSKFLWYLQSPLYFLIVVYAILARPRPSGFHYWWKVARQVHEKRWGKL